MVTPPGSSFDCFSFFFLIYILYFSYTTMEKKVVVEGIDYSLIKVPEQSGQKRKLEENSKQVRVILRIQF